MLDRILVLNSQERVSAGSFSYVMRGVGHLQSIPVGVVSILSDQQLLIIVLCCVVLVLLVLLLVLLLLHLLMSMNLLLNEGKKVLGHLYEATMWH